MSARPAPRSFRAEFGPAVNHLEEVLRGLRAGRATPGLVENIEVGVYGSRVPLKSIASISTPDPKTIQVEPWDKTQIKEVEKALATSPLGVNPQAAGTTIRLTLPSLTEERRFELKKLVRQHLEETKGSIRQTREKLLKELRSWQVSGELSEDAFERERKKLQDDVDAAVAAADTLAREKESQIGTQ